MRTLRRKKGISQDDLSSTAGLSRTSIVNIERCRQGVSIATLYRLADALNVSRGTLLPDPPTSADDVDIKYGDTSPTSQSAVNSVLHTIDREHPA